MLVPGDAYQIMSPVLNLHTIHTLRTDRRHMLWFCSSRNVFRLPRRGRLRPMAGGGHQSGWWDWPTTTRTAVRVRNRTERPACCPIVSNPHRRPQEVGSSGSNRCC